MYVVNDFGGSGNDLYIEVHDIVYGSNVDYAEVSVNFTAGYPGNVQFSTQTFYANESQDTVSVAVQRSAGSLGAASVEYALSTGSSATLGSDFNFSPGTLYWEDGEDGLKTFNIDILQDGNIEDDKTINLVLQNVTGASLNSLVEATVTLEDDDLNDVEVSISTGNDDVEEEQDGNMDMNSSDLEMVHDSQDQIIGLRFNNINIPQSAKILNAYIQFTVDEATSNETNLIIHGENIGDAQTFDSQNVSSRSNTSNIVNWSVPAWSSGGLYGEDQRTPDLSSIVTEIVNLQDWILGNSMVFKITGSGKRVAESYEGAKTACAKLHIEYSNPHTVLGVGIIENDFRDKLLLYPNPTSGNFSIDLGSMHESVSISIIDITGRLVHSKTFKNSQLLNLKLAEPTGVYILIIESGDQNSVIRLIKK